MAEVDSIISETQADRTTIKESIKELKAELKQCESDRDQQIDELTDRKDRSLASLETFSKQNVFQRITGFIANRINGAKKFNDKVIGAVKSKISSIKESLPEIKQKIDSKVESISSKFTTVKEAIKGKASDVKEASIEIASGVKDTTISVAKGVKHATVSVAKGVKDTTISVASGVKNVAQSAFNKGKESFKSIFSKAKDVKNKIRTNLEAKLQAAEERNSVLHNQDNPEIETTAERE